MGEATLGVYGLATRHVAVLVITVALLVASVGWDLVHDGSDVSIYIEDAFKFLGLLGWCYYWMLLVAHGVRDLAADAVSRVAGTEAAGSEN